MPPKTVVVTQPMFFPWPGLFEQMLLADVFVYYDDVQFSKGSFMNRVQIKTKDGSKWMTVPVRHEGLSNTIGQTRLDGTTDWREHHLSFLRQQFDGAPFREDALTLVRSIYEQSFGTLGDLCIAGMRAVCEYFGFTEGRQTVERSSRIGIAGASSKRVLDIVLHYGGERYVTGHGAKNYLDHAAFEAAGVSVEYMNYAMRPYRQQFGKFTPAVSILDLIANMGRDGLAMLQPRTVSWREFVNG